MRAGRSSSAALEAIVVDVIAVVLAAVVGTLEDPSVLERTYVFFSSGARTTVCFAFGGDA